MTDETNWIHSARETIRGHAFESGNLLGSFVSNSIVGAIFAVLGFIGAGLVSSAHADLLNKGIYLLVALVVAWILNYGSLSIRFLFCNYQMGFFSRNEIKTNADLPKLGGPSWPAHLSNWMEYLAALLFVCTFVAAIYLLFVAVGIRN